MSEVIGLTTIKKSRKPHNCWWCPEKIEKGESYIKWACTDPLQTIKCHPECRDAWNNQGGWYECGPYEHERGI